MHTVDVTRPKGCARFAEHLADKRMRSPYLVTSRCCRTQYIYWQHLCDWAHTISSTNYSMQSNTKSGQVRTSVYWLRILCVWIEHVWVVDIPHFSLNSVFTRHSNENIHMESSDRTQRGLTHSFIRSDVYSCWHVHVDDHTWHVLNRSDWATCGACVPRPGWIREQNATWHLHNFTYFLFECNNLFLWRYLYTLYSIIWYMFLGSILLNVWWVFCVHCKYT